tara:strand:+ start:997 stop:1578 length:582 start_codon:yes stop_codon:yes gene_type:complete
MKLQKLIVSLTLLIISATYTSNSYADEPVYLGGVDESGNPVFGKLADTPYTKKWTQIDNSTTRVDIIGERTTTTTNWHRHGSGDRVKIRNVLGSRKEILRRLRFKVDAPKGYRIGTPKSKYGKTNSTDISKVMKQLEEANQKIKATLEKMNEREKQLKTFSYIGGYSSQYGWTKCHSHYGKTHCHKNSGSHTH